MFKQFFYSTLSSVAITAALSSPALAKANENPRAYRNAVVADIEKAARKLGVSAAAFLTTEDGIALALRSSDTHAERYLDMSNPNDGFAPARSVEQFVSEDGYVVWVEDQDRMTPALIELLEGDPSDQITPRGVPLSRHFAKNYRNYGNYEGDGQSCYGAVQCVELATAVQHTDSPLKCSADSCFTLPPGGHAGAGGIKSNPTWQLDPATFRQLIDTELSNNLAVKGYSVSLVRNGKLVDAWGSGLAVEGVTNVDDVAFTEHTPTLVGSVSKYMTQAVIFKLISDRAEVLAAETDASYEDAVKTMLARRVWLDMPEQWQKIASKYFKTISYRDLFEHRAGFRVRSGDEDNPEVPAIPDAWQLWEVTDWLRFDWSAGRGTRVYSNQSIELMTHVLPMLESEARADWINAVLGNYMSWMDDFEFSDAELEEMLRAAMVRNTRKYVGMHYEYTMRALLNQYVGGGVGDRISCDPQNDYSYPFALAYRNKADQGPGGSISEKTLPWKEGFCVAQGGWYISAFDLARINAYLMADDNFVRRELFDLAYDFDEDFPPLRTNQTILYWREIVSANVLNRLGWFGYPTHGGDQGLGDCSTQETRAYAAAVVRLGPEYLAFLGTNSVNCASSSYTFSGTHGLSLVNAFEGAQEFK